MSQQTVIGFFDNATEAQQAVQQLQSNGFSRDSIDISSQNASNASTSGTSTSGTYNSTNDDNDSIGGFFRSLFGDDDDEARTYSTVARNSGCMVTVHAQSSEEASRAADILDDNGAVDVDERASQYGYGSTAGTTGGAYTGTSDYNSANAGTTNLTGTSDFDNTNTDNTDSLKIIEENLQVGKRVVQTGGARIRSRIIERPVEESLRLREEHVNVERTAVNRPATEADLRNFQEGEITITESAEVPVVNKEARVVEEISLNKQVEEREETIRDTVRKTEVDVENFDATTDRNRLTDTDNDTETNRY